MSDERGPAKEAVKRPSSASRQDGPPPALQAERPGGERVVVEAVGQAELSGLVEDHRKLLILYAVANTINSILDLDRLLHQVLELIFGLLPADRGAIFLRDDVTGQLLPRVARARDGRVLAAGEWPVSQTILQRVLHDRTSLLTLDAAKDDRLQGSVSIRAHQIRSAMCVPLVQKDRLLGALQIDSQLSKGTFTKEDLMLLTAIANQAAVAIENAKLHQQVAQENRTLREGLHVKYQFLGEATSVRDVLELVRKVAPTESTVLLRGESGTGKELIARSIHLNSPRHERPFVVVNCSTLTETLLESELFGHEKGAFTGAAERKIGKFEQADGGTVFLDEVGAIPSQTQVKLLRVLEQQEFERVGSNETKKVNLRIIGATNEDLERAMLEGRMREDLYFRLNVIQIYLPPLRNHAEDVPGLVAYYLGIFSQEAGRTPPKVSPEAMRLLTHYAWPGNVRELRNCMERAIVLGVGETLLPEHLTREIQEGVRRVEEPPVKPSASTPQAASSPGSFELRDAEKEHIFKVLMYTAWNKSKAATLLGISRPRLDRKIKDYSLQRVSR